MTPTELNALLADIQNSIDNTQLYKRLLSWRGEPLRRRLNRLGQAAKSAAERANLSHLNINVIENPARLPPMEWHGLWSELIHIIRNSLAHGIEPSSERSANNKDPLATITIETKWDGNLDSELLITISDDGRGIDFDKLRDKARTNGLEEMATMSDNDILFSQGISSTNGATELAGRGVGLSAVAECIKTLGGRIEVKTKLGQGTRFVLYIPISNNLKPLLAESSAA